MPNETPRSTKKKWYKRLRDKYRLIIRDDETLEPKFSFRLSRWNVFVVGASSAVLLIILTIYLIAFTPLREYIPGYTDASLSANVYDMHLRADSLEHLLNAQQTYINNLMLIINGQAPAGSPERARDTTSRNFSNIALKRSREDSVLRREFELRSRDRSPLAIVSGPTGSRENFKFFTPLKGMITNEFNPSQDHYGIDLVAPNNEAVKATLDGIVVFANWTIETGYVIILQHQRNFVSVYKHNAVLLKKPGAFVRAGDPIAIVGESGQLTTGPHLHFELWYNAVPVNPRNYMTF